MKIVLATCGSRGDVQPMAAICLALQAAGHEAVLLGPPERAGWAKSLGCRYRPAGRDVTAFIDRVAAANDIRAAIRFIGFVRQETERQFQILPELIRGAGLVLGASLMFGLSSVAESLDIPYRYVAFTAQMLPSGHHPFPVVPYQGLPGPVNRLSWKLAACADRFNIRAVINRGRRHLGLMPVPDVWDHILGKDVILACDPEIAPVPADIAKTWTQTGYPHLDLPEVPLPGLDRFLESGKKPVYAGFGSMPAKEQVRALPLIIQSAKNLDRPVIIACPAGINPDDRPCRKVIFIRNYPHGHLFSRTDAVIHHGGAGTTAVAALSGVPQVIVPHILDQFFHGHRIFSAGLGPEPIPRSRLTARRLTQALEACLTDPVIRDRAAEKGRAICPERSLRSIVAAVSAISK